MRLAYITSLDLGQESAAAIQIAGMIKYFSRERSICFYSIDGSSMHGAVGILKKLGVYRGWKRKVCMLVSSIRLVFFSKIRYIYCREIVFAIFYALLGKVVLFELHELNGTGLQHALLRVLSRFDTVGVVTVSEAGKNELSKLYPALTVFSLPNGVDLEPYIKLRNDKKALRNRCFGYREELVCVYSGSLYKGKDVLEVIDMAQSTPEITYFIVGGKATEYKNLLGGRLDKNIYHVPQVPHNEIAAYQVAADFLFYPISYQNKILSYTSPLKIFEYWASLNPVVCAPIGAVSELLNKENSYVYKLGCGSSYRDAITRIDADRVAGKSILVQNAYEVLLQRYTLSARVKEVILAFKKIEFQGA